MLSPSTSRERTCVAAAAADVAAAARAAAVGPRAQTQATASCCASVESSARIRRRPWRLLGGLWPLAMDDAGKAGPAREEVSSIRIRSPFGRCDCRSLDRTTWAGSRPRTSDGPTPGRAVASRRVTTIEGPRRRRRQDQRQAMQEGKSAKATNTKGGAGVPTRRQISYVHASHEYAHFPSTVPSQSRA